MRNIAELTMLLRGPIALPDNLSLETEEFRDGWNLVRSGDTHWLDTEIRRRGWHFIRIGEGSLRGGVGYSPQEAIAGALKLALRRVSERFNAAKVESIELKKYPWFELARVEVYPYQIQQGAVLSSFDRPLSIVPSTKVVAQAIGLPLQSHRGFPISPADVSYLPARRTR